MLLSEYQKQTQFEVHLEKFQSGLNVKKWKLEKLDCAGKDYTWEQAKQWPMGKMRSSLNFLLSGFSLSIYLHLCSLEVLMGPASFSDLMLVNPYSNTEQTFLHVWQTGDSHFSTDDSIHGFSGWFKLKFPSSVLIFKGFFPWLSPELVSQHHFSNHTNNPDLFSLNSCAFCQQATSSKELYGVSWNFWAWGVLDAFCEQHTARSDFCLWSNQNLFNSGKNEL